MHPNQPTYPYTPTKTPTPPTRTIDPPPRPPQVRLLHFWNTLYKPVDVRSGRLRYERSRPRLLAHRIFEGHLRPIACCYEARRLQATAVTREVQGGGVRAKGGGVRAKGGGLRAKGGGVRAKGGRLPEGGMLEGGWVDGGMPGAPLPRLSESPLPRLYEEGFEESHLPNLTSRQHLFLVLKTPRLQKADRNLNGLSLAEAGARRRAGRGSKSGGTKAELKAHFGFRAVRRTLTLGHGGDPGMGCAANGHAPPTGARKKTTGGAFGALGAWLGFG